MTRPVGLVPILCALTALGCDSGTPTGGPSALRNRPPAPGEATPAEVVVAPGVDSLFSVGASTNFGAVVVGANGSVIAGVPVWWSTNAPGVAAVDRATGTATALSHGQATIRASAGGAIGEALLIVDLTSR